MSTGGNNSFFGSGAGELNTSGTSNSFFGFAAGQSNMGGGSNAFFGDRAGDSNVSGTSNTIIGSSADVGLGGLSNATAIGADVIVSSSNTVVLGRNLDTVQIPGNFLRSNGTNWTSSALQVSDIPNLSSNYVQNNPPTQQSANFNINGNGTVGGTLAANVVQAATQYNIGLVRILSGNASGNIFGGQTAGINNTSGVVNSFFGNRAGEANIGGSSNSFFGERSGLNSLSINNSFFGAVAGQSNTSGNNNTVIGTLADVGSPNLTFETALGAGAVVASSNNVTLGRAVDTVQIPGNLNVTGSLTGSFTVPAGNITGILSAANGGSGLGSPGVSGNFLRSNGTNWTSSALQAADIPSGSTNYIQNLSGITPQTASFNISGNGFVANTLTASVVNATQFNNGGDRILIANGNNLFAGIQAGQDSTTGGGNSFVGRSAGRSNTTGSTNSFFGGFAGQNSNGSSNSFFGVSAGNNKSDAHSKKL